MSNKKENSSLRQAIQDLEEIKNFAKAQAEKKLQEEIDGKILQIIEKKLNEDVNISVCDDGAVVISKDGEELAKVETDEAGSEGSSELGDDEFIEVSSDDQEFEEPIEVSSEEEIQNENMLEMEKIKNEQEVPAQAAPAAPAPEVPAAPTEPVAAESPATESTQEDPAIASLVSKIDTLINVLMQQQGVSTDQATDQEFEVIDDEAAAAPAPVEPAPAAEVPAAPAAPVQEDTEFEIEDFEDKDEVLEIIDDLSDSDTIEIVDEDEMCEDCEKVEETRGASFTAKRTGDKTLKMDTMEKHKGHHAPVTALQENKDKAHYESKIDELIKENKGLKKELGGLKLERKEFEDAFVQLREQFDEMQTFNGKLALVNKLLMNGGLSFEEKLKVCEQFDSTETIEEAQKLYKNIIKENNIKVGDVSSKIKPTTTHTAKSTESAKPLYESEKARRLKQLAGLSKGSEE